MSEYTYLSGLNDPNASDDDRAIDVIRYFDESQAEIRATIDQHHTYLQQYYGIPDPQKEVKKDLSNLHVPLMESIVDTNVSKLFMTIMSHDPFISFVPESREAVLPAKKMERVIRHLIMDRIPDAVRHLNLWVRNAVLYGTGVLHLFLDQMDHFRTVFDPTIHVATGMAIVDETGNPILTPHQKPVTDYRGIRFEVIDLLDFACDWNSYDFRRGWVAIREWLEPDAYLERVTTQGYLPLSSLELESLTSTVNSAQYEKINYRFLNVATMVARKRRKIELIHFYGKAFWEGVRQDVHMVVTRSLLNAARTNGRVVWCQPFGLKPVCLLRYKDMEGQVLGRGVGAMVTELQRELNTTRNQRIDNIAMELNGGWIIEQGTVDDEQMLVSTPNQVIEVLDMARKPERIQRLALPPDAFNHEEVIKNDAKDVCASNDILRGQMPRKETATTATLLNQNAGERLEATVFTMGSDGLKDLGNMMRNFLLEFPINDKYVVQIKKDEQLAWSFLNGMPADNIVEIGVNELEGAMFSAANISAINGDKYAKIQSLLQLLQIAQPYSQQGFKDAQGNQVYLNVWRIIKELGELWKIYDIDQILVTISQQQDMAQKAQMAAMMAQAQQQGEAQGNGQAQTAPAEIGGQTGAPPVGEKVNQDQGVLDAIQQSLMGS